MLALRMMNQLLFWRSACGEDEETGDNHLLQCDACLQFVHMDCYGVSASPEGRLWLCDACYLGAQPRIPAPRSLFCAARLISPPDPIFVVRRGAMHGI